MESVPLPPFKLGIADPDGITVPLADDSLNQTKCEYVIISSLKPLSVRTLDTRTKKAHRRPDSARRERERSAFSADVAQV